MPNLDFRLRDALPHLRQNGRLNVLLALILRANIRNRCWPSMDRIAADTGYGIEAVNEAKKWLAQHGAIEIVKYAQRLDEEREINPRQNVYQLTGVLKIAGVIYPYLYVALTHPSTTEISIAEISTTEGEVVKVVEVVKESKKDSLPAAKASGESTAESLISHTHTQAQEAEQQDSERSASKQGTSGKNAATPIPQVPPAPLSHAADPKEVKPESEKARIQRERMEAMITAGGFAPPVTNADFSNFRGVLKTLDEAGITPAMYPDYVKWVRDESKRTTNWTVSLRSLTNNMRPSTYMAEFRAGRRQISTQGGSQVVSTVTPVKNAYNPLLDDAYAPRDRKQA